MISERGCDIRASKGTIWNFITDPTKISYCLPDVKSLEMENQDEFRAVIRVGVRVIKSDLSFDCRSLRRNQLTEFGLLPLVQGQEAT